MTKRDFQAKEYVQEQIYSSALGQTLKEHKDSLKFKYHASLTNDERFAIRYCLNFVFKYHKPDSWYGEPEIAVSGVKLKETIQNLFDKM